ncbi:MAG: hypothetical protein ACK4UY_03150 [Dietzia sp.]
MPRAILAVLVPVLFALLAWLVIGPHHRAFPWVFSAGVFGILGVLGPWPETMVPRWVTSTTQRTSHRSRALGIPAMIRALDRVGWNRALGRRDATAPGRAALVVLRTRATQSLAAHGVGAMLHLLVAIPAAVAGAWMSALILVSLGVLLHLIPVAMQRYTLARIDRVDRAIRSRRSDT